MDLEVCVCLDLKLVYVPSTKPMHASTTCEISLNSSYSTLVKLSDTPSWDICRLPYWTVSRPQLIPDSKVFPFMKEVLPFKLTTAFTLVYCVIMTMFTFPREIPRSIKFITCLFLLCFWPVMNFGRTRCSNCCQLTQLTSCLYPALLSEYLVLKLSCGKWNWYAE